MKETITKSSQSWTLWYFYDESGRPFAFKCSMNNGATVGMFYYVLNLQGDVVSIVAASGMTVANYTYNAWGEVTGVTSANGTALTSPNHIANLNPLRYRGYYYDTETGFYYLQSRYYYPTMHRFINADTYASTGQGFLGHNMFAYCRNNPICYFDDKGTEDSDAISADGNDTTDAVAMLFGFACAVGITYFVTREKKAPAIEMIRAEQRSLEATIKAVKEEIAERYAEYSDNSAVFYGVDTYGGPWKIVTGPMNFFEAVTWVVSTALTPTYGRSATWGLYTEKQSDAIAMAIVLGGIEPEFDPPTVKTYPHYHVNGRDLFGYYKHFHVWYGKIGGY